MLTATHLTFLANPAWQGIAGIMATLAIFTSVVLERRRRRARPARDQDPPTMNRLKIINGSSAPSSLFDLSTEEGELEYYRILAESIRQAQTIIYRSGRAFSGLQRKNYGRDLINAEEFALRKGVRIIRVQTADRVSKEWADGYARLAEKYPGRLKIYADFRDPLLVNIGLIDPAGPRPEIQILFESIITAARPSHAADAALSVYGPPRFARSLQDQFERWTESLRILDPDQIRDLAHSYLYFAYGSNMSPVQMRQRCPNAERLGTATAYGWERNFAVAAPHMGTNAAAAGIRRSDDSTANIEGVVYDLTAEEKATLDDIERGGYVPAEISFMLAGKHVIGFTHLPISLSGSPNLEPRSDYVRLIIEGAEANGLTNLARELRQEYHCEYTDGSLQP